MDQETQKYMLVLDDRVFYQGLTGNKMNERRLGSLTFYAALSGDCRLKLGDGEWQSQELAMVPPYQPHQVATESGQVIIVMIEPERLDPEEREVLTTQAADPDQRRSLVERFRQAAVRLAGSAPDCDVSAPEFDRILFGRVLEERKLDWRISSAIEDIRLDGLESASLASDLAADIGLSSSRFLHLFKDQTGVSFRNYRMWRRARTFLMHANNASSLTDVALSLGYPDSSHFSRTIRKIYGLKPRSIRVGSQNLRVAASPAMAATLTA